MATNGRTYILIGDYEIVTYLAPDDAMQLVIEDNQRLSQSLKDAHATILKDLKKTSVWDLIKWKYQAKKE